MKIILASQSPRRRELLGLITENFLVRPTGCDESFTCADPAEHAHQLALRKCAAAVEAQPLNAADAVIAADTVVVCDGKALGKPATEQEAAQMLQLLSGCDHEVMTGVTVLRGDRERVFTEVTDLHFRPLSEGEIARYVASGEPMDKAGSYGIQGGAALFADRMHGDYYNVMGLPVCRLGDTLKAVAPELMGEFV